MKRCFYFILLVLISAAAFFACDNFKTNDKEVSGILLNQPHCKNHITKAGDDNKITNNMSVIQYSYDIKRSVLTIKHINAGFNCCPGRLSVLPDISRNKIVISENESEKGCKCLCLYDLEYAITGVPLDKYKVEIKEPYLGEQDPHIFDIDLSASVTGQHIVSRTEHPWESPSDK